jgi:hypothetical protein
LRQPTRRSQGPQLLRRRHLGGHRPDVALAAGQLKAP